MAENLDAKELVSIEERAISSMWEMTALVEVLEGKGILTKKRSPGRDTGTGTARTDG